MANVNRNKNNREPTIAEVWKKNDLLFKIVLTAISELHKAQTKTIANLILFI